MSKYKFNLKKIDWSLYAIIDREWLKSRTVEEIAEQMIRGGAGIIQYRDKTSETNQFYNEVLKLRNITKKRKIPLIINDRIDIALATDSAGIHLGNDDLPVHIARKLVKKKMIIGASVQTLSDFEKIKGADYLGIGAIYPTKTHKNYRVTGIEILKKIRTYTNLPIIGIGGITIQNLIPVLQAGCDGVAVISAILSENDIEKVTRRFIETIRSTKLQIKKSRFNKQ